MNRLARSARHRKVFGTAIRASLPQLKAFLHLPGVATSVAQKGHTVKSILSPYLNVRRKEVETHSATNTLFKRYTGAVTALFILSTVSPFATSAEEIYAMEYASYADSTALESSILADNDGYLTKVNPQTNAGDRSSMNDMLTHTVASGETLSTISNAYGIKTQTVLWENGLANANSLRVGQKLLIPPVDGVSHKVAKNETVESIAKKYSVDAGAITKQNKLLAGVATGDEIYIPGAKPLYDERTTPARVGTASRVGVGSHVDFAGSSDIPIGDRPFIFPTRGKLTQGFRAGHYAFDIADTSKPPIWAAGSGKVVKASSGTWGGGYGNHIIIDHGNGLKTLYAHMDYLDVSVGDIVEQGQVLGRMGKTGRVYGRTGIHLHFEVIKNGVKQVPSNYY